METTAIVDTFCAKNPLSRIGVREDSFGLTLSISGYLELKVSYDLQNLFTQIIDGMNPGKRLTIDLSAVSYISSTGVGALTTALIEARKRNVDIVFRRVPKEVLSVLKVLGLTSFLPMDNADD